MTGITTHLWWTGWRISGRCLVTGYERVRTINGHFTVRTCRQEIQTGILKPLLLIYLIYILTVILVHGQHGQHFLIYLSPDVARVGAIVLLQLLGVLLLQLLLQLLLLLLLELLLLLLLQVEVMLAAYVVIREAWLQVIAVQHNNARAGTPAIPEKVLGNYNFH